jgi:hypothetical protein
MASEAKIEITLKEVPQPEGPEVVKVELKPVPEREQTSSAAPTEKPTSTIECESEQKQFLEIIERSFEAYAATGANSRSSKKVTILHAGLTGLIREAISKVLPGDTTVQIKNELDVKAVNDSGRKRCDIVVLRGSKVVAIFPVKFIMTNYSQNKNNYFESLTGEITHLKWANPDVHICPINIIPSIVPYKKANGVITKFEQIGDKFNIYEELVKHGLCSQVLNYKIDVEYPCRIGDTYRIPKITGMSPYVSLETLFEGLKI